MTSQPASYTAHYVLSNIADGVHLQCLQQPIVSINGRVVEQTVNTVAAEHG